MTPQTRLTLFLDATLKLVMVNPDVITNYARKVVSDPSADPARTVQHARAVLAEQAALQNVPDPSGQK